MSGAFPPDPSAVRSARRFVEEQLGDADGELLGTAVLLVSELATNSVRHAATPFTISVDHSGPQVQVEVRDEDPTIPVAQTPTDREAGGRGLAIVARLAASWGVEPLAGGKVVWFRLTDAP